MEQSELETQKYEGGTHVNFSAVTQSVVSSENLENLFVVGFEAQRRDG